VGRNAFMKEHDGAVMPPQLVGPSHFPPTVRENGD
jgi:hypothetical protein